MFAGVGVLPAARAVLWRWEQNPILRGRLLAEKLGCPACHLPDGDREIPNPGSRWGTVPRFGAGNAFMYAPERSGVEEFIRFGAPRDWLADAEVVERLARQHIRMPAYGEFLDDRQVSDLVAWVCALEGIDPPEGEAVQQGLKAARRHGCFSCHGVAGSGGLSNPRSLGGFIPGFLGRNFEDLVENETEFREWILDGTSTRLSSNPLVAFFWRRQSISMPAYRDDVDREEIELMWSWVQSMRATSNELGKS